METLLAIVVGICAVFWAGYLGARRYPTLASLLAVLLLIGSATLARSNLGASSLGDGAPSGAGAFIGLLWLLEVAGIFLAGTLLVAGWRGHDNPLSKTLLFVLCIPVAVYAVFQAFPQERRRAPADATAGLAATEPTGTRRDGYVWALDANFLAEADCQGATPEFIAGCKEGVAKNLARQAK